MYGVYKKERDLRSMMLCGNSLPWVKSTRHLGNKIEDKIDGTRQDMREKRWQFIQMNNEICQEFSFADSTKKIWLNNIFNTHFTGSPIWGVFCGEADTIENTWNVAMRKMMKLNRCSHRFLIEPLSQTRHIKFSLMKRFINFMHKILNSTKTFLKSLKVDNGEQPKKYYAAAKRQQHRFYQHESDNGYEISRSWQSWRRMPNKYGRRNDQG